MPALAVIDFKTTSEFIGNENSKPAEIKSFEYLLKNVEAGSHHFSIYRTIKRKEIIGIVGSIENSENYFKLEQENIPHTVISVVPEPKKIIMMMIGLVFIINSFRNKNKLIEFVFKLKIN